MRMGIIIINVARIVNGLCLNTDEVASYTDGFYATIVANDYLR